MFSLFITAAAAFASIRGGAGRHHNKKNIGKETKSVRKFCKHENFHYLCIRNRTNGGIAQLVRASDS